MAHYVIRRIVLSVGALFIAVSLVFLGNRLIGDPARLILGPTADPAATELLRDRLGLEDPLVEQYVRFLEGAVRGDFGESFRFGSSQATLHGQDLAGTSALGLAVERVPWTLAIAGVALGLAVATGLILGSLAAMRPGSAIDRFAGFTSLAGVSIVEFWLGLMLVWIFAIELGWFPTSGYGGLMYFVLPAATLTLRPMGRLAQIVRTTLLDELAKPYVETARAKGLSERRIVVVHGLRNAAVPSITMVGDELNHLLTGVIVVETVFGWPGLGLLLVDALSQRDLPVVEATVFVVAVIVLTVNAIVDISYRYLDPRTSG